MRLHKLPGELLAIAVLSSSNILVQQTLASPTVNVGLQASFNSPPYLLELLYATQVLTYQVRVDC